VDKALDEMVNCASPGRRGCSTGAAARVSSYRGGNLEALSDVELVSNHLRAGGGAASIWLQELFRRHYTKVVTWCLRVAGDRDDALDLAQGVFVKAQRHLREFRGDSKVSTWLYSITRSECLNYLKARSMVTDPLGDGVAESLPDDPESRPEHVIELRSSVQAARALLDRELTDTEKRVFTMHYGDDVPLPTITRLLGLQNRSGAKAYLVSARRKLARALQRWRACEKLSA
jgi:RNA polymerase sigma-70 factor (ECF subfamily)